MLLCSVGCLRFVQPQVDLMGKAEFCPRWHSEQALPEGRGLHTRHSWDLVSQYLFGHMTQESRQLEVLRCSLNKASAIDLFGVAL